VICTGACLCFGQKKLVFLSFTNVDPQSFDFYSGDTELRLSHLTGIKQKNHEPVIDYIRRFRDTSNQCFNLNIFDKDLADLTYS
jgi:hypothetical protein